MAKIQRRDVLTSALVSALAGATICAPRRALAVRDQKLIYWHVPTFTPAADDLAREQFEEFRKMAGLREIEAAFVPTADSELIARLSAALEAGTPPDVVRLSDSYVRLYRAQGHMMDVTDVVERMKGHQGGIFDPCLRAVGHAGKCWGVPFAINPWLMYARIDLLKEHGLDYPRTWDAFVEACLKIQKPHFHGFGMDLGLTVDATDNILQVCWCFGGRTYDADGNPAFDNEGNVKGFAFINEMYNKYEIIPKGVVGNRDPAWNNKAYQSGQVAFITNPTGVYAYLSSEDPELMKKTGLFGVPAGPAGAVNRIDTFSLGLFKQAPYPELAKGLAEYFMEPSRYNEVIVKNNGRLVPVYPDLLNGPWWTGRPEFKEFLEVVRTGAPISFAAPPSAASGELLANQVIPEALQAVLIGGVDPAEAVAQAHRQIAAIAESFAQQKG